MEKQRLDMDGICCVKTEIPEHEALKKIQVISHQSSSQSSVSLRDLIIIKLLLQRNFISKNAVEWAFRRR